MTEENRLALDAERLNDIERELGISGEVSRDEARAARVMIAMLLYDVEQAISHRRAVDSGEVLIGRGGYFGTCPPSALLELQRRLRGEP